MCTCVDLPQEVDRLLGDICGRVHDALPPRLGRAVCAALSAAVQSVLLDGGPYRWAGWRLLGHWAGLGAGRGCVFACRCVYSMLRLVVCDCCIYPECRSALGVRNKVPSATLPNLPVCTLALQAVHAAGRGLVGGGPCAGECS